MYPQTQTESFWEWAEQEREERDLSWYRVEQRAGLSNAAISKRARELLPPTSTTIQALATVFKLPREFVFQKAGVLPPHIIGDPETNKIVDYYRALTDSNRQLLLRLAEALHLHQTEHNPGGQ